jgi:hypothetical protein
LVLLELGSRSGLVAMIYVESMAIEAVEKLAKKVQEQPQLFRMS